jgi:uncharacterized RDD family membrane protein YckC
MTSLASGAARRGAVVVVNEARHFWPAAGFWIRALGLMVDALWLGPLAWSIHRLARTVGWLPESVAIAVALLGSAMALVVCWWRWQSSLGKALCRLQVVRLDGKPLGWRGASLRLLGYGLSALAGGLGFAMIGLSSAKRGLHDLLANTYVGRRPRGESLRARLAWKSLGSRSAALAWTQAHVELGGASLGGSTSLDSGAVVREQDDRLEGVMMGVGSSRSDAVVGGGAPSVVLWRRALGAAGALVLGAVLLFGAWAKVLDPLAFAEQIGQEGLDFLLSARAMAILAIVLEVGLGVALMLNVRRLWVLVPTAFLVGFFLFLTGRAYYLFSQGLLEPGAGCGCFGNLVERTPAEAFWQDLALLVPALLLAFVGRPRTAGLPSLRLAGTIAAMILMGTFAWLSPRLPIDDLATRLDVGERLDALCTGADDARVCLGTLWVPFESGEHLVVIADLADAAIGDLVTGLNAYSDQGHSVVVLSAGTPELHRMFFWQWGPMFEIVEAPAPLLRSLYRSLPRSFRVADGVVSETWAGLPPFVTTAPASGSDPLAGP